MRRLLPRRPALRVQLTQGLSDDLNEQVASGKLDLAVTPIYADVPLTLHQELIVDDKLCVAASRRHPLAARRKLALRDLTGLRWILPKPSSIARNALDSRYADSKLPLPAAALEVEHFSKGTLELLAHSDLLALLPQSALGSSGDVVALPVALGRPLPRSIALISRQGTTWSPLMNEFRRAILDCAAAMA